MRIRLSKTERRADILEKAKQLFIDRGGLDNTEMEDIRLACGISRGGLYYHFPNKRAVLFALVEDEVIALAQTLEREDTSPIVVLLQHGSVHFGAEHGILAALRSRENKIDYLSALDEAFAKVLTDALGERLIDHVKPDIDPAHVAELFITVNAHINRRQILGYWTHEGAARFATTALTALLPLLQSNAELNLFISKLKVQGDGL